MTVKLLEKGRDDVENEKIFTRISVNICIEAIKKYWYLILLSGIMIFAIMNLYGWRSYDARYRMSITFVPAKTSSSSTIELGTQSKVYSTIIKNEQVNNAVRNAVDFKMTSENFSDALSVSENSDNLDITVTLYWTDKEQLMEMTNAFKAYLSYIIEIQLQLGDIIWLDNYMETVPVSNTSRYVTSLIYGGVGGVVGVFLGCFFIISYAIFTECVYDMRLIQYHNSPLLMGVIPRKAHPDFQNSCETLSLALHQILETNSVHTIGWVTIGHSQRNKVSFYIENVLERLGCSIWTSFLNKEILKQDIHQIIAQIFDNLSEDQVHIIKIPDILNHKSLWYILPKTDLLIVEFKFGHVNRQMVEYVEENSKHIKSKIYLWTDVSKSCLRNPTGMWEEKE